jgi:hypothetical protein
MTPRNKLGKTYAVEIGQNWSGKKINFPSFDSWKDEHYKEITKFVLDTKVWCQNNKDSVCPKFFLHARSEHRENSNVNKIVSATEFEDDVQAIVTLLEEAQAGEMIAGVILGEHEARNTDEALEFILKKAEKLNSFNYTGKTGYLKNKIFIAHGAGFGAKFEGIGNAITKHDFFNKIKAQSAHFAFSFKIFDAVDFDFEYYKFCDSAANQESCRQEIDFSNTNSAVWKEFLLSGRIDLGNYGKPSYPFGLAHLRNQINEARNVVNSKGEYEYRNHANVVFVGDSADGIEQITLSPHGVAAIDAVKNIFKENRWTGFIFGSPFDVRSLSADKFLGTTINKHEISQSLFDQTSGSGPLTNWDGYRLFMEQNDRRYVCKNW